MTPNNPQRAGGSTPSRYFYNQIFSQYILRLNPLLLFLCAYVVGMLQVELDSDLGDDALSAGLRAFKIASPMLALAAVLVVILGIGTLLTIGKNRKNPPVKPQQPTQANTAQDLPIHPPRGLYPARLGLLAMACLGIAVTTYWPYFLVGGWASLGMIASCLVYVTYFWPKESPTRYAQQQRMAYHLHCYLWVLPCYLIATESVRLWWPENLSPAWLLLACFALTGIFRRKLNYYAGSQLPPRSKWPSLAWIAGLCTLLGLLSVYGLDQPLAGPTGPSPFDFLLWVLLGLSLSLFNPAVRKPQG